ncbi:MAG TPA: long-chain-fatty-acid--CoA ligase [Negativicutes bacterium]
MFVHQLINQGQDDQVVFQGTQQVTYRKLRKQVSKYRDFFYQQGVRFGDNVGLLAKNSPEFIYSYMAIVGLGAIVVPLNFQLVPREIGYIVQDANIKTVITMNRLELDEELKKNNSCQAVKQLVISEFRVDLDLAQIPSIPSNELTKANEVCTIIYTSGTTGNPKGAVLTHENLISDATAFTEVIPVTPADNLLCVLPMYHCFGWTCVVLAALLRGACITPLESFAFKETTSAIRELGVTVVFGVPAMYTLFATRGTADDFRNVKIFVSGGASLPAAVANQFAGKFGIPITEGYGLSEASPVVTFNPLGKTKIGSIGKPIPGVEVRIVDGDGRILPAGVTGELITRGPNVMKCYYNLPDATAQALRGGWLYTGDVAYQDEEGYVFIVDRLKDMIITSGENVYPREIEELLYAYPSVLEAAVVDIPDRLRGQAGCAYLVLAPEQVLDKKAVLNYLQGNLAHYKIPREFVQVDALPKNSTGKIWKRVLREQAHSKFNR